MLTKLHNMQYRRMFGERTLSPSLINMWPPSWILRAEKGRGEKEISTKGVVDRWEEGGGRRRGKKTTPSFRLSFPTPSPHFYRNQTWRLGNLSLVYNANLRSLISRLHCKLTESAEKATIGSKYPIPYNFVIFHIPVAPTGASPQEIRIPWQVVGLTAVLVTGSAVTSD